MVLNRNALVIGLMAAVAILVVAGCATLGLTATDTAGGAVATESTTVEVSVAERGSGAGDPPPSEASAAIVEQLLLPAAEPPFSTRGWITDFSRRSVEWEEILSGGPPKDGIPAIDEPTFESVEDAGDWLQDRDPVIVFQHNGEIRAYPLAILIWHEIVNDEVGGLPVSVTFCPLCNASIVFDRRLGDRILDFGTTGKLRNSDLVMYDRQTESWWQQFIGTAIVGELLGSRLRFLPSQVLSFGDFTAEFPEGQVLARPPVARRYGANPYVGYDSQPGRPFLFTGELDTRLPATERVVGIDLGGEARAYPFSVAAELGAINDDMGDMPVVILHKEGTASALDAGVISEARDVGSTAVFERTVGDQVLTFAATDDGLFTDAETGSTWNILGEAVDGELQGSRLNQVLAFDHFWFAWSAFFPQSDLYAAQ